MEFPKQHATQIKNWAQELGFSYCGISKAEFLHEEAPRLDAWLKNNYHGEMSYMENYYDKRLDPRLLVEGAQSVVSLLYNYFPQHPIQNHELQFSKYAWGNDYHEVVKEHLKSLLQKIQQEIGEVGGRVFVDSAPVLDRAWAAKSGLGWIGKNSMLINKTQGSFFFCCELIIDLELEPDQALSKDYCGTCTACIDACPTDAIIHPKIVDGSKCISYFTIELKNEIPKSYQGTFGSWVFGCDICQDICPWNRFSKPHSEKQFNRNEELLSLSSQEWIELTEDVFSVLAKHSPVKRTKLKGMKRNIQILKPRQ